MTSRVRRLQVPAGSGSWWGVDPGTRGLSVAFVTALEVRGVSSAGIPALEGGARLAALYGAARGLVRALVGSAGCPGVVLVEMPAGARPNPALSYAVGAIMCAAADEVPGARVEDCSSGWWKKAATGFGGHRKPTAAQDPESYGVLRWARGVGYRGGSWDEADAMGVAEAARRTIELVER